MALIVKKDSKVNLAIIKFLQAGVTERDNNKADVGEYLCKRSGASGCYSVDSLGEGICKAGKGSNCFLVKSITHGLDRISKEDRYWYWDRFSDQYGSPQWRCRGSQTGQFANNSKCSGQLKDDKRWPD
jgi:hypothetical protein